MSVERFESGHNLFTQITLSLHSGNEVWTYKLMQINKVKVLHH